jgi:hypothetical protein
VPEAPPEPDAPPALVDVALGEPPEPEEEDEADEPDEPPLPAVVVDVELDVGVEAMGLPLSEQAAAEAANETQSRRSARLVMLVSSRAEPAQAG